MTDRNLRELNRQAAQGDLDAQARHLFGRIRAGELTRNAVELAAWLGDRAARRVPGISATARQLLARGHHRSCPTLRGPQPANLHARALARVEERRHSRDWPVRVWAKHMRQRLLDEDGLALRWPGIPPASTCPLCLQSFRFPTWLNGLTSWKVAGVLLRASQVSTRALTEFDPSRAPLGVIPPRDRRSSVRTAVYHLSEQTVREAIRDALVPWVLASGEGPGRRPVPNRGRVVRSS